MIRLQLESATDILDLDGVYRNGVGVQARSGVTGLGLPPKSIQWLEGAGDGAIARHRRVLPRDIDIPLYITGGSRDALKSWMSRLSRVLASSATLRVIEPDKSEWTTAVEHVGGGSFVYGVDTIGDDDLFTVITLRAGDPYFTSATPRQKSIESRNAQRGLLVGGLTKLGVATSQLIGTIDLDNDGDATAYPVWQVYGPGDHFVIQSPRGETLQWTGTLTAGQSLTVNTRAGTIVNGTGANEYAKLAPAPRFWAIPPGKTTCVASLQNGVPGQSRIVCSWQPRKWMVV